MNKDSHSILEIVSKIRGNLELLNCTLNLKFDTVLDIGLGDGLASLFFAAENKKVVPIGINIDKYNYPKDLFKVLNINIIETSFSEYQTNNKYNAIWASHILEHVQNVGEFLEKCRNLLTDDGWLFVLVPPYKNTVVGGHVTTGWNIGQLLYNLLLTGYNIKTGHFIQYGYNICGFVQKSTEKLPPLMMDKGDIEATSHLWPIKVSQEFNGDIEKINWFENFDKENNEILLNRINSKISKIVNKNPAALSTEEQ